MNKLSSLCGILAAVFIAGCGSKDAGSSAASNPAPEAPAAPAVNLVAGTGTAPAAPKAPAPAELPPVPELKEDEPLGGKGRPLTPEEKSLLNYGIYMFKEEKGRFPKDLNEAVATRYITQLPQLPKGERLNYDPRKGVVTVVSE